MAIFLEGCDLSGKTTATRKLAKRFGLQDLSARVFGPNLARMSMAQTQRIDRVVDRWWPTEWVYRKAEGRMPHLNLTNLWVINLMAERWGGVYIQLEPDDLVLMERFADRGDEKHGLTEIMCINGHYQLQNPEWWSYLPGCRLVNPKPRQIKAAYEERSHRARCYPGKGLGSLTPRVLFIGDQMLNRQGLRDDMPFVQLFHKASPRALYTMLTAAGLRPSEVHLHNAFKKTGEALLLRETVEFLQPAKIIALGSDAAAYAMALGLKLSGTMPHPSWMNRFHFHDLAQFVPQLKEIVE